MKPPASHIACTRSRSTWVIWSDHINTLIFLQCSNPTLLVKKTCKIDLLRTNHLGHILTLTLPMLRLLLLSKAQGCKDFRKPSKPCHIGIHWLALVEYSQMSTNYQCTGVSIIFQFFWLSFCIGQISHQQHKD